MRVGGWGGGWSRGVFIWLLALQALFPWVQPQALPSPLGSEAAAAGLCAGQCILKVNGNNVMSDGAPQVLEHFQAFRSHREEALVSRLTAKGIREALLSGWLRATLPSLGRSMKAHSISGGVGLPAWQG